MSKDVERARLSMIDQDTAHAMAWVWRAQPGVTIEVDEHTNGPIFWFDPGAYIPAMDAFRAYCNDMLATARLLKAIPEGTA